MANAGRTLLLLAGWALVSAALAEPLVESGFEEPFQDGMAPGWVADSYSNWGDTDIRYERDPERPHSGEASLRISVGHIGYINPQRRSWIGFGAAQVRAAAPVPLTVGQTYHVRAWLRASEAILVKLQIRQAGKPWWPYLPYQTVVREAWEKVEFLWTSANEDPTAWFLISFSALGSVWIDDVLVEPVAPDPAPAAPGNLLANGDFDLGLVGWLGPYGWDSVRDPEMLVEEPNGNPCLRLVGANDTGAAQISDSFALAPGRPLTARCRLRATGPVRVDFGVFMQGPDHAQWAYGQTQVEVATEWREVTLTTAPVGWTPFGPYGFVRIVSHGPETIWIDDVVVRQDGRVAGDERVRAALVSDRHPRGLYRDDEPVGLSLRCSAPPATHPRLMWRVIDDRGAKLVEGVATPVGGRSEASLYRGLLPRGWYRAEVHWRDGGRDYRHEATFCVLPAPRSGELSASPFGGHFMPSPNYLDLVARVGVRWIRLWPPGYTLWRTVEPEPGRWSWPDEKVRALAEAGLGICGMLESPPAWANGADPEYPNQWERYVATTVEHYRPWIRVWEVQNEPDLRYWVSKPDGPSRAQVYVETLKRTAAVIKRVDPDAIVMGGSFGGPAAAGTDGEAFVEEMIALGALECLDVLSFHYYHGVGYERPMDEGPDPVDASLARLRERMRASGRLVPIENSEGGIHNPQSCLSERPAAPDNPEPMPADQAAMLTARMILAQWAAGVQRFYFYNLFVDGCTVTKTWDGFIEGDGQPRPVVAAYAALTHFLGDATYEQTERPTEDTWIRWFATPRGRIAVVYARSGTLAEVRVPGARQAWDIMGRPIPLRDEMMIVGPQPVYISVGN